MILLLCAPLDLISIHALREEGDTLFTTSGDIWVKFLSTPSARRATAAFCRPGKGFLISIHALREEGDAAAESHRNK